MASDRKVSSILDDDDVSDIIHSIEKDEELNALFDDDDENEDDEFERYRQERERRERLLAESMRRNETSPPSAPSDRPPVRTPDEGVTRVQFYQSLQRFLQAMTESAPLYMGELKRNPGADPNELKGSVSRLCSEHLRLVDKCLEINNANTQNIMLRYQRRSLARNLSELYENYSIDEVEGLIDVARDWANQSIDFEHGPMDSSSNDTWLNVKLSLFVASLKYYDDLDGLWCSHSPPDVMFELQKIAVQLAKEVAFSWSKRSQVSDRESLFTNALTHCLKVAQMAYIQIAMDSLSHNEHNPLLNPPALPFFKESVQKLDVGYIDDHLTKLLERTGKMASAYLAGIKIPCLRQDDLMIWKASLLKDIDSAFASAWDEAANDLLDELDEMSEEEQEAYTSTHEYMDFERFESRAIERLSMLDRPGRTVKIDFSEVLNASKRHLAWIWGISDSLIAARKDQN